VVLHGLGRVTADRARDDVLHVARTREVLEGSPHGLWRDRLLQADRRRDLAKRFVEVRA
jgi:hypothetical protein